MYFYFLEVVGLPLGENLRSLSGACGISAVYTCSIDYVLLILEPFEFDGIGMVVQGMRRISAELAC